MILRLATMAAIVLIACTPAYAQEQRKQNPRDIDNFETLPKRVRPGQTVYINEGSAPETSGTLVRLSDTSITVLVQGAEREFPRQNLERVTRRGDSVVEGMGIGMAVGGGLVLASIIADDAPVGHPFGLGVDAALIGTFAAIGGGIGALIDFGIKGNTLVYRRPATAVTVRPVLLHRGRGVGIAVRFPLADIPLLNAR